MSFLDGNSMLLLLKNLVIFSLLLYLNCIFSFHFGKQKVDSLMLSRLPDLIIFTACQAF